MSRIFRELNKTQPGGPPPPRPPEQPSNPDRARGDATDIASLRADLDAKQLDFNQRAQKLHVRETQLNERIAAIERRTDELFNKAERDAQDKQADILKRLSQTQAQASRAQKENAELQIRVHQFEAKSKAELKRDHNRVQLAEEAVEATQRNLREYTQEIASILTAIRDQDAQRQALVAQMQATADQVARDQHDAGQTLATAQQTHAAEQETVAQQRKEIESLSAQTESLNKHIARLEDEQKSHAETNEQRRQALHAKLVESQNAHATVEKALTAEKDQRTIDAEAHKKHIQELNVKIVDLDRSLSSSQSEFKRVTEALDKEAKQTEQLTSSMKANETRLRDELESLQTEMRAAQAALQAQESAFTRELNASGDALLNTIDSIFSSFNTADTSTTPKHITGDPPQPAKQSADAINELNAKIADIHEVSDATRQALQRSKDVRHALQKEAQGLERSLRDKLDSARRAAASAEAEKQALTETLEEQRQNEKAVAARRAEEKAALSQRLDGLTKEIEQRQTALDTLEHKYQALQSETQTRQTTSTASATELESQIVKERALRQGLQSRLAELTAALTALQQESETARAATRTSVEALETRIDTAKASSAAHAQSVSSLQEELKATKASQEQQSAALQRMRDEHQAAQKNIEQLAEERKAAKANEEQQSAALQRMRDEHQAAQKQIERSNEEREAAKADKEQLRATLQRMRDEHQAAQKNIEQLAEEREAAKASQEQQSAALQRMRDEHQAAQKNIGQLNEELDKAQAALNDAQAQSTSLQSGLQSDLTKARATASAAETQRQALAASLDALAASHTAGKANEKSRIDALEQELERGQSAQREFAARIVELEKQTTNHRHVHQEAAKAYRTDIEAVTQQLYAAKQQHTVVAAEHEKAVARIRELESELGSLREKSAHTSGALQESLAKLTAEQRTQHTAMSDRIQTLEGEADRARSTLDTAQSQLDNITEQRRVLETDIQTARDAVATSLNERQQLQERIQKITNDHAQQKAALEADIARVESKLREATASNDAKSEQLKTREAEAAKERQTAADRIDETRKQLDDEKTRSRQQLKQSEKGRNALQSELEDARQSAQASLAEVERLKTTLSDLKRDQAAQQRKLRETTRALDSRIHEVSTIGDEHLKGIEKLEGALRTQKTEQESLQQKLNIAEKARQSAVEDARTIRTTLEDDLAKEREAHNKNRAERDQQIATLKDAIQHQKALSERAIEQATKAEQETRSQQVEASKHLGEADATLKALRDELRTLESTHSDRREQQSKQTNELDQRLNTAESTGKELRDRVHALEQSLAETDRLHAAVTDEQKMLQQRLAEVEAERQASLAEASKRHATLSDTLEKERKDHSHNRDAHSKQVITLKEQIQELQATSDRATTQWKQTVEKTTAQQEDVTKRLKQAERARGELEKELAQARSGQSASQKAYEALRSELTSLQTLHSESQSARVRDTQDLEQRIQKTDTARQELHARLQQMESALEETHRDLAEVTQNYKHAVSRNQDLEQAIAAQRKALQSDIQTARDAIEAAGQERDQLERRIQSMTDDHAQQTAALNADHARVQAELDKAAKASQTQSEQLRTLEAEVLRERKAATTRRSELEATRAELTGKIEAAENERDNALGELALARAKMTQLETTSQQSLQENATLVKSAASSAAKLEETRKILEDAKNRNRQQLQQSEKARSALQAELDEARSAAKRSLAELDELRSTLSELKQDQDSARHKLHETTSALDSRIHDVSTSGDAHVKRIEKLEHALRDQQKQQATLQKKLDASETARQTAVEETQQLRKTLSAEFEQERQRHEKECADRDKRIETLTSQIEQLQNASDTAAAQWNKTELETRQQQDEANKRLKEAERARAALEKELARARGSQSASQQALQTLRQELEALEATHSEGWQDRSQRANDLDARIHKTEASRRELQHQVQQLEQSLAAQKQRETELAGVVSEIEKQYRHAANANANDATLTFETLLAAQHVLRRDFDNTQRAHKTMRDAMADRLAQAEKTVETLRTHVEEHTLFSTSEFAELESVLKELHTLRETITQQGSDAKRSSEQTDHALRDARDRIAELETQLQSEIAKSTQERESAEQAATRTYAHLTEADAALSSLADDYTMVLERVATLSQTPALDLDLVQHGMQHVAKETERLKAHVVALLEEHSLTTEALHKQQLESAATLELQQEAQEQRRHVERLQNEKEQAQKDIDRDEGRKDAMIERLRLQIAEMSEEADQSTQLLEGARQELIKQKETYDLSLQEHILRTEHKTPVKQSTSERATPAQQAPARHAESDTRISELSTRIEMLTSTLAERDARQAKADRSLKSLKQANAELRKSNDDLKAAASASKTTPPAPLAQWLLKLDDDREFGPVDTATLCEWATDSRIGPDHQVSSDGKTWQAASAVAELHMDWLVELVDGSPFGPVNVHTVQQLIQDGDIAPTSQAVYKRTQSRFSASEVAHPELGRVIEAREQLKSENDKLATALRDAEARIKELETRPTPMAIPPKQIKLPPKMVRASRAK